MGQPIPAQHPAVVLRSHFKLVQTLLAIAMAAVLALTAAVVILVNDEEQLDSATKATPALQQQAQTPGTRYDGGPEEGTRGAIASPAVPNVSPAPSSIAAGAESAYESLRSTGSSRYDGGPEEGTRGPLQPQFKERAGGPTLIPNGPGSR
jgi:hypothetical protein